MLFPLIVGEEFVKYSITTLLSLLLIYITPCAPMAKIDKKRKGELSSLGADLSKLQITKKAQYKLFERDDYDGTCYRVPSFVKAKFRLIKYDLRLFINRNPAFIKTLYRSMCASRNTRGSEN